MDPRQNGHSPPEELPLSARLLGVGVRGARTVGKATGIDRAAEIAAEEAIVGAIESEAVERAMTRVLQGPVIEDAVQKAVESAAVKRALLETLDSELVDEVWRRLLASEEAQQLVERIAGAPELRAAISAQGAGLLEDIGRTIGNLARRVDDTFERVIRRLVLRKRRPMPTNHAGAISRALAFVIDAIFVNLSFTAAAAVITLVRVAFGSNASGSAFVVAVGSFAWFVFGGVYLVGFWSLGGQTPGMRFVGIRLSPGPLPLRQAIRRLFGMGLCFLTLGLGFLGVVFRENRRGWQDRIGRTDVVYDERRPDPAPWATAPVDPVQAPVIAAETEPVVAATAPGAAVGPAATAPGAVAATNGGAAAGPVPSEPRA